MVDDRGQALTVDALFASFILLTSVAFAYHVLFINPDTLGYETDAQVQMEDTELLESLLSTESRKNTITKTLLYWDTTNQTFYNTSTSDSYYTTQQPPTELGNRIGQLFPGSDTYVNIEVRYYTDLNTQQTEVQRIVWYREPPDNAVAATQTVTLHDSDEIRSSDTTESGTRLDGTSDFYAPDISSSSIYNVVQVKVTAWTE